MRSSRRWPRWSGGGDPGRRGPRVVRRAGSERRRGGGPAAGSLQALLKQEAVATPREDYYYSFITSFSFWFGRNLVIGFFFAQNWKRSVFVPIPEKGHVKECSNYCTIVLISHAGKIMRKILQARLQQNVSSMDMNLNKLQETVEDREPCPAAVRKASKIWTQLSD